MAAKTITVFSNKGGVGKTFICVNTATALALSGKKVLLVDLDFQSGQDMARMLNIAPRHSIVDALPELEKTEDLQTVFKTLVATHASGVDFITSVANTHQISLISPETIRPFFRKAQQVYDFILVDVGKSFTEVLISVLDMSNLILLIATPDILAVYQIKWGIEVMQSQHFPLKMIKLVLNRSESHGGVAWQEVKAALGCDIIGRIPSDGKTVGVALNRGIPCVVDSPRAKVSLSFHELANALEDEKLYVQTTEVIKVRNTAEEKKDEGFWEKFGISEAVSSVPVKYTSKKEEDEIIKLKKRIHEKLIDRMNLKAITPEALADSEQVAAIKKQAERIVVDLITEESGAMVSSHQERSKLVIEIINEALGLGPLEDLLADPGISDIMVNNKDEIYVEKSGKLILTDRKFLSNQQVRSVIDRIIAPLGRRIDESVPMVDARLPDGSRINAIIPPLSLRGPMITIRKFGAERITIEDLLQRFNSISQDMADFIHAAVVARKNMIVSGGTGSGKTTLLNIISQYIPDGERIITIEDAAELRLNKSHWARLESRPVNVEGKGGIAIRDLFVNTLRMRPDRIIIGECRGPEVLDMLQAMNTGHDGSLTTIHANSTRDAVIRMNALILLSGIELPLRAVYEMIASAIDIVVHIARFSDGSRKITGITEVTGNIVDGLPELKDVFVFKHKGIDPDGRVLGDYIATGYIPECFEDFVKRGLPLKAEIFSPSRAVSANPK
jgi:septum site-determining protein MinD